MKISPLAYVKSLKRGTVWVSFEFFSSLPPYKYTPVVGLVKIKPT